MNRIPSSKTQGNKIRAKRTAALRRSAHRPRLEPLEHRALMAVLSWTGDVSSVWSANVAGNTNWSGDQLPVDGDTLIFAGGSNRSMTNDTTGGNRYDLSFTTDGFSIVGSDIALSGASAISDAATTGTNVISAELIFSGNSTINVANAGHGLDLGAISSSSAGLLVTKTGAGLLTLDTLSTFGGTIAIQGGAVRVGAALANDFLVDGGTLAGSGSMGDVVANSGSVSPGAPDGSGSLIVSVDPGELVVSSLSLAPGSTFVVSASGTGSGQFDQVDSTGLVNIAGAILDFSLAYTPNVGDSFRIIDNQFSAPVNGTFFGLPNGASFVDSGTTLRINYDLGDGNDVVVTVIGQPVATPDTYALPENSSFTITLASDGILANDTDPQSLSLRAVLVDSPSNGTLQLNGDGTFTYTPAVDYFGPDSFTYVATNGLLTSPVTLVTLNVNQVIEPPIANGDSYTVLQDGSLLVAAPGVLQNDVSPQGTALSAVVVVQPVHAQSFIFDSNSGAFTYIPVDGFSGTDTFTYRASDGTLLSSEATVTITIEPIFLAPTVVDDAFTATADQTFSVVGPGVLSNDTNPNPTGTLTAFLVSATSNGTVTLAPDGSFNYTPNANFSGTDSFTYRGVVGDAESATTATVTITVNPVAHPPIARDDVATVVRDSSVAIDVLANDSDVDPATTLSAVIVNQPLFGTVVSGPGTLLTYTPNAGYVGNDSFTYRASDGTLSSEIATVNISVTQTNLPPTAFADAFSLSEDSVLSVAAPGVLANDVDPQGFSLSAFLVAGPANGALTLNANGSFVYTPNRNFSGTDTFVYRITNGILPSAGNVAVTLTVNHVAEAPVTNADTFRVNEGQVLTVAAPGVRLNDVNPNPGAASLTVLNGPSHGVLVLQNDGSFVYTPEAEFFGVDSFTYFMTSESLTSQPTTVTLNVAGVPTTPTAVADAYTAAEDTLLEVGINGVLANDLNPDRDTLNAVLVSAPMNGQLELLSSGLFRYTPRANFVGVDTFTYRAANTSLSSAPAVVTITVVEVAVAPTARDDRFSVFENATLTVTPPGLLFNDLNENTGAATITVYNAPTRGSLVTQNDGSFVYTPGTNFFGTDSFTYFLTSSGLNSGLATVTIDVLPVATTPTAVADSYGTNQNVPFTASLNGVLANDLNPDRDTLNAILVSGPLNGSVNLNSNGSFTYTPYNNFFGTDTFTYRVVNSSLFSAPATVTMTVAHVNQPPITSADAYTIERDQNLVVPAPGVLTNDSDPDASDTLSAVLVLSTQNGTLSLQANGSFVYQPFPGFVGTDSFSYAASDGTLRSVPTTVTINVRDVPATTVELDPKTDLGSSSTDRITRWTSPSFMGTTGPGLEVRLSVRPLGTAITPTVVGSSTADSAGSYYVTSSPLADGQYEFFVAAHRPDGRSTGSISAGPLTIDTISPRIIDVQLTPKLGQMYLAFTDEGAGLDGGTVGRPSNFSMARYGAGSSPAYSPTNFNVLTSFLNPNTFNTVIRFAKGKPLPKGWYIFAALSGGTTGIQDVAGNALAGTYTGTLPTGNSISGGDFRAYFKVGNAGISLPRTAGGFVPILPPVIRNPKSVPTFSTPQVGVKKTSAASAAAKKPTVAVNVAQSVAVPSGPIGKKSKKSS